MSTDLVQLGAQPQYDTMLETGLDSIARLTPTNLILVQNTTRDPQGARPGQYLDVITGAVFDAVTVVPLQVRQTRVLFPPGDLDLDAEPICKSDNGIVPSDYAKEKQAVQCKFCPKNDWTNGRAQCKEGVNFLLVGKEGDIAGLPRYFQAKGFSIPPVKFALKRIRQDIALNEAKGLKLQMFDYYFTLTSERKSGKTGAYFVVRIEPKSIMRVQNPSEFGPAFEEWVISQKRAAEERRQIAAEVQVNQAVGGVIEAELVSEV